MKRLKGMLYGSFVGDAVSLSTHWIYDTEKIKLEYEGVLPYKDPSKNLFHNTKKAGDLTHYGDQSLLLLKSIATNEGFDNQTFKNHWMHYMKNYEGYIDNATKTSLEILSLSESKGSNSDDLSGIARISPLIYYHFDDTKLSQYVKRQTELTHNDYMLLSLAQFTVDWVKELIIGHPLEVSLQNALKAHSAVYPLYEKAIKHKNEDLVAAVKDIGQSCSCLYAFPSALLILLTHASNFEQAMEANVLCGGDSASRGMYIGMILGASLGFENIPKGFIEGLNASKIIDAFSKHKTL